MMVKEKNNKTPLEYWTDALLLRKQFEFETDRSVDSCAESLSHLTASEEEQRNEPKIIMTVSSASGSSEYSFDAKYQRFHRGSFYNKLSAQGSISRGEENAAIVQGYVKPNAVIHALLPMAILIFLILVFFAAETGADRWLFVLLTAVISAVILGIYLRDMVSEQTRFIEQIRDAVMREKAKRDV